MQEYSYSYTKHIYAGTQRIASKLGDIEAFGADPRRVEYAGANLKEVDFGAKYKKQTSALFARYDSLGVMNKPRELNDYVGGQSFCCGEKEFEPSQTGKDEFETSDYEQLIFFYHPDHLGSTSLVTDNDGNVVQSVAYIPYGEVFIEERNGTWNTPYLFNGKELDEETGLYYYSARYLNPTSGMWLSVDPLFEKYVGMSPYQYCHNNPINRVDVDGRFDTEDEVWHFCWDYEINGRVSQRSDGTYEIYDESSRATYYHDSEGVLNTDLPEFVVEAKRVTPKPAEPNLLERADDWANGFGAAIGNYLFYSDAYSLYLGGTAAMGPGVSASIEVGYMKGEGNGWFFAYSGGVGTGVDLSVGGGFKISNYSGSEPMTIDSYKGEGTSYAGGVFLLDFGYSISKDNNWNSVNVGVSGSPLQGSGTIIHTQTYIP